MIKSNLRRELSYLRSKAFKIPFKQYTLYNISLLFSLGVVLFCLGFFVLSNLASEFKK